MNVCMFALVKRARVRRRWPRPDVTSKYERLSSSGRCARALTMGSIWAMWECAMPRCSGRTVASTTPMRVSTGRNIVCLTAYGAFVNALTASKSDNICIRPGLACRARAGGALRRVSTVLPDYSTCPVQNDIRYSSTNGTVVETGHHRLLGAPLTVTRPNCWLRNRTDRYKALQSHPQLCSRPPAIPSHPFSLHYRFWRPRPEPPEAGARVLAPPPGGVLTP